MIVVIGQTPDHFTQTQHLVICPGIILIETFHGSVVVGDLHGIYAVILAEVFKVLKRPAGVIIGDEISVLVCLPYDIVEIAGTEMPVADLANTWNILKFDSVLVDIAQIFGIKSDLLFCVNIFSAP